MNVVIFDATMTLMALLACAAAISPRVHTGVAGSIGLIVCAIAGLIATDKRIADDMVLLRHALVMLASGVSVVCGWRLWAGYHKRGGAHP